MDNMEQQNHPRATAVSTPGPPQLMLHCPECSQGPNSGHTVVLPLKKIP